MSDGSSGGFAAYFATIDALGRGVEVTDGAGLPLPQEAAITRFIAEARQAHARSNTLFFIGNGGSAAIASHMAIDYSKNGGMRALALNDGAALTCLGNDLGYENVFAGQLTMHARAGDVLVAISSSGRSPSILNAVDVARTRGCFVLTLSGFQPDNPLRTMGDLNLYVANGRYGYVEITHLALCHAMLDMAMERAVPEETTTILETSR
ncbi:SIS domain-containing protein [Azospirillum isscasi]|uniref:SIS domain-containing protein n=1 Tax=Azospirillum isscasi TaxID=3053926 RepID=A0ABU0WSV1_9PROT|nr:SIS domain-containing protein [Azospirillum isscasi]MDQ2105849.1 SIS domain-containing protein [Azospirillum isscasi]